MSSLAPYLSSDRAIYEQPSITDITSSCLEPVNVSGLDVKRSNHIAMCLMYRGDITPHEVKEALGHLRNSREVRFVDWSPCGIKVGINSQPAVAPANWEVQLPKRSCCLLSSNMAIGEVWSRIDRKFGIMKAQRGFVHWYVGEGLSEGFFT